MAKPVTYTFSLIDRITAPMTQLVGTTDSVFSKISETISSKLGDSIKPIKGAITAVENTIGYGVKNAITLDEQFAKVNITAQLEGSDFDKLKKDIIATATKNKVDVMIAPAAYEKIISQTGDVDLSLQILDSTLKGSKAGFTEVSVVADALSQSLSIVGKDSATASEILDTFFAAKRVGAGNFGDLARYMPSLMAEADALGIKYKELAGIFAYMTGKGQSAERASTLISNMFSILGRGDVTDKLKKAGVNVFDNGKIRSSVDIFRDMSAVMSSMDDEQKSGFIEALGIVDTEAKSAFMVMISDVGKLQTSLAECANAAGETDRALELSANTAQRAREIWTSLKNPLVEFGTELLPAVNAGLDAAAWTIDAAGTAIKGTAAFFGGWYDLLQDGNPAIWAATTALGLLSAGFVINKAHLIAVTSWTKIKVAWDTILSTGSRTAAASVAFFNSTMLATPWGMALVGISAVAAALIGMRSRTDDSTKSFAAFNAELHSSKKESGDMFEAAQKAAIGSRERAAAIAAINDKYKEYLPNMIAESATNEEIAATLTTVNGKLEENLRLKYVKQEKEVVQNAFFEVEKGLFEEINRRFKGKAPEEMVGINAAISDMLFGKADPKSLTNYVKKMGGDISGVELMMTPYGATTKQTDDGLTKIFSKYYTEEKRKNTELKIIDAKFILRQKPADLPPAPLPAYALQHQTPDRTAKSETINQATQPSQVSIFNYGNQLPDKSQVDYLSRPMFMWQPLDPGYSSATSPALAVPPISEASTTNLARAGIDTEDYGAMGSRGKTLDLEKFCDQIVINIAKADTEGVDTIRTKVMEVLKEVIDGYNA